VVDEAVADSMRTVLRRDLQDAIKGRRTTEVKALRGLMAAIDNAEAVQPAAAIPTARDASSSSAHIAGAVAGPGSTEATRRKLTLEELRGILDREVAGLEEQAAAYEALGRVSEADHVRCKADVIERYLVAPDAEDA
jgi:uncharacterized protein